MPNSRIALAHKDGGNAFGNGRPDQVVGLVSPLSFESNKPRSHEFLRINVGLPVVRATKYL